MANSMFSFVPCVPVTSRHGERYQPKEKFKFPKWGIMCNISLPKVIKAEPSRIASCSLKGRYLEERLEGLTSLDNLFKVLNWHVWILMFKIPPIDMGQ